MKVGNFAVVGQSKRLVAARFHICPNNSRELFFSAKQEIGYWSISKPCWIFGKKVIQG